MKKYFLLLSVYVLSSTALYAQTAFNPKQTVLQFGIGYGLINTYGDVKTPPISATLDFGASQDLSVGGYIGYASSHQVIFAAADYPGILTEDMGADYTYFILGGRVCYHFDTGNKNLDGYIGAMLGYNAASGTLFGAGPYTYSAKGSSLLYGGQLGGRYFVSPNVALFGELGYGVGYITAGLSFKI
jgi:hypothetical protein